MEKTTRQFMRLPLAVAISAAAMMASPSALAFQFDVTDEVKGSLDTTMSYGALWRVSGPDSKNVGAGNGGKRNSSNYDNGNINYESGDLVQSLFKVSHDLDLSYKNFGAFGRVIYFYDEAIEGKQFNPNTADNDTIHNRLGSDYEIYDAYLRGSFAIGERNVTIRAGKQVVSWGESTFIPNGINVLNPVDVAKLRSPGSELKEAFLPIGMFQVAMDLTDNLSLEVVQQYQFRATRLEPNGTYFSTNDHVSPGGTKILIAGAAASENPAAPAPAGTAIPRNRDIQPSGGDQVAVAARLLVPELNNTEFGLYFANYHSRTPLVSGYTTSLTAAQEGAIATAAGQAAAARVAAAGGDAAAQQAAAAAAGTGAVTVARAQTSSYLAEHPDDIRMVGLSFNTLGPWGVALQGEYSYRPNQPVQIAANNLLAELLSLGAQPLDTGINAGPRDAFVEGYKRVKAHQAQVTATQTLGRYFGADQIVGVVEAGYTYLDLPSGIDFNGTGVDVTTNISRQGLMTRNSYGYRMVLRSSYNNAIGAINLSPRVAFSHDLRGNSPTFSQGAQAVTVGIGASYQNNWEADLSYTNFYGGENYNVNVGGLPLRSSNQPLSDRDFVAATVSYSF